MNDELNWREVFQCCLLLGLVVILAYIFAVDVSDVNHMMSWEVGFILIVIVIIFMFIGLGPIERNHMSLQEFKERWKEETGEEL